MATGHHDCKNKIALPRKLTFLAYDARIATWRKNGAGGTFRTRTPAGDRGRGNDTVRG